MSIRRISVALAAAILVPIAFSQPNDVATGVQAPQDPRTPEFVQSRCSNPPIATGRFGGGGRRGGGPPPGPVAAEPVSEAIDGVIEGGLRWSLIWSVPGNNADGIIATDDGGVIVAGNDARNVVEISPTGAVSELYTGTNTGGAVSRSKSGALFLAERGFNPSITQLEPVYRILASQFNNEPMDCIGGVLNDLAADSRGGVYFTYGGLFYADAAGQVTEYGQNLSTNGVILSPDEQTLYVTNARTLAAFDVEPDGSLVNQREFAPLAGPRGDGATIDAEGRIYVSTGAAIDVFAPDGAYLGTIPGAQGLHGVAFSGPDKQTLYAIIYDGTRPDGPVSEIVAIPMLARGYAGRAK